MGLLPPDFESGAYTNFATPALGIYNDRFFAYLRQAVRKNEIFRQEIAHPFLLNLNLQDEII